MWVNPTLAGNTWQQLVRCHPFDGTGRNSLFINNGGFISWRGFSGGAWTVWSETAPGLIPADEWTFIAVSGDTNNINMYVGGDMVQEDAFQEGDSGIEVIQLGGEAETPGEAYSGIIDDFALWNETLSNNQVVNIMESGVSSFMAVDSDDTLTTTWASIRSSN